MEFGRELILGILSAAVIAIAAAVWRWKLASLLIAYARSFQLAARLKGLGLHQVYGSRADYAKYRRATRLIDYLSLAKGRIIVSGYWLAQGAEMEGVLDGLEKLIKNNSQLHVDIVVMDPAAEYVDSVALSMDLSRQAVVGRVNETLLALRRLYERIPESECHRLRAGLHTSQPIFSIIALDPESKSGRIQVDIKPFGVPRSRSISFELRGLESILYLTMWESCRKLIDRALPFDRSIEFDPMHPNSGS